MEIEKNKVLEGHLDSEAMHIVSVFSLSTSRVIASVSSLIIDRIDGCGTIEDLNNLKSELGQLSSTQAEEKNETS